MNDEAACWLAYLGRSPEEPSFDKWLDLCRIYDRPHHANNDEAYGEDEDQAIRNARASEIEEVERLSIALIYENARNYKRLFGEIDDIESFVLKQLVFYAKGVQGYRGFAMPLPFGVAFGQNARAVRDKLGPSIAIRIVHGLKSELWVHEDLNINVSYISTNEICGILHIRRAHLYDLRMLGKIPCEHDAKAVDVDELLHYLGGSAYDAALIRILDAVGWNYEELSLADCDEIPDLIKRKGLTLYMRDARQYKALQDHKPERDGAVFAGFRLNRIGDMNSEGHLGRLPFGIEFHHTPEQAIVCVGRQPDETTIAEDVGSYQWELPQYRLHVAFSLIDYQVYRVSCFAKFLSNDKLERVMHFSATH